MAHRHSPAPAVDAWGLPQPRHLFHAATGTLHYHFGLFEHSAEPLHVALHRMVLACARHLPPGARVLDVGCGLGGSARLLARLGHAVVGLDPCAASLALARAQGARVSGARFLRGDFLDASALRPAGPLPFDALLMLEVLQHFGDLDRALERAGGLVGERGLLVVADLFRRRGLSRRHVPYARRGELCRAAERAGWVALARRELTRRVQPTMRALLAGLRAMTASDELPGADRRPALAAELAELEAHCAQLRGALERGDLRYHWMLFQPR